MTPDLRSLIREVPDHPRPGVLFKDVTTLLKDPAGLASATARLVEAASGLDVDLVAGAESRGFVLGPGLAVRLGAGFVLLRKPGRLPAATVRAEYELEYGADALEVHADAIRPGQRVLVTDDLLATGGTARAAADLVERLGGTVAGFVFLVELAALGGRKRLGSRPVRSVVRYDD